MFENFEEMVVEVYWSVWCCWLVMLVFCFYYLVLFDWCFEMCMNEEFVVCCGVVICC